MAFIVRLRGILVEKTPAGITVECAGVGYGLSVPLSTFDRLPPIGQEALLFVHHIVREDDALLFGFHSERERNFFKTLLSISGIGPKLALSILSGLTLAELTTAIVEGDIRRLSSISGVGKKTAERIIVELKDKINPLEAVASTTKGDVASETNTIVRDAILSLVALGNKMEDARKLVQTAYDRNPEATVQDLIRLALRK
ncbi:MAG: Holliday junction branch migration protein RuvA [Kiritimatiellae bacterium]|nr:Holliday junction branch migration protein RuvA [Kiritimatiellia bacterium]